MLYWLLKLNGKGKRNPYADWNDYLAHKLLFFKKNVALAVFHTYADQASILPKAKFCPVFDKLPWLFCSLRENDLAHSSFQTLGSYKFGSKIIIVLNVQTRTTLEQKMMPIKNEQFCTIKKDDLMISGELEAN